MARLHQPPPFYGTRDGICIYEMYGFNYMRTASSLTGERVKKDPVFKNTMAWAERLAAASKLAAAVYAMLPNYRRKFRLYRKLTGKSMQLLKAGKAVGETVVELLLFARLPKKKATKITGERSRMRLTRRKRTDMVSQQKTGHYVIAISTTYINCTPGAEWILSQRSPSLPHPRPAATAAIRPKPL